MDPRIYELFTPTELEKYNCHIEGEYAKDLYNHFLFDKPGILNIDGYKEVIICCPGRNGSKIQMNNIIIHNSLDSLSNSLVFNITLKHFVWRGFTITIDNIKSKTLYLTDVNIDALRSRFCTKLRELLIEEFIKNGWCIRNKNGNFVTIDGTPLRGDCNSSTIIYLMNRININWDISEVDGVDKESNSNDNSSKKSVSINLNYNGSDNVNLDMKIDSDKLKLNVTGTGDKDKILILLNTLIN